MITLIPPKTSVCVDIRSISIDTLVVAMKIRMYIFQLQSLTRQE